MDLDTAIRQKRSELREAYALCLDARKSNAPEPDCRQAEERFKKVGEELAALHREKFGEWRAQWVGPIPQLPHTRD